MAEIKIKTAGGGQLNEPKEPNKLKELLASLLFYLSILTFFIGFQFSDTMVNGWYQQFMPGIGNKQITDIAFLDSLNGYAVATQTSDSSYILKTINGGDNWQIIHRQQFAMTQIQFLNLNTGYAGGGYLYETTDGGFNWTPLNTPATTVEKMFIINQDTIFFVNSESLTGGVFRTINGGASWDRQLNLGSQNPNHIYMFNGRIGFIGKNNVYLRRTTNSGLNWDTVSGAGGFLDMHFVDSLTGWKVNGNLLKTINGGINWINQVFPFGGNLIDNNVYRITKTDNDTLWCFGGYLIVGGTPPTRGILFRTSNSGDNWLFQLPDTSIHIVNYFHGQFTTNKIGWAYNLQPTGIHTTNGGNDTFYTSVKKNSSNIPDKFYLGQNYPNPFNPVTKISYELRISSYVKLAVYDIMGKELSILTNQKQSAGTYKVTFDGTNYSSGVYFYSLIVDGKLIDTKRMVLVK